MLAFNNIEHVTNFLLKLDNADINYTLQSNRYDAITISVVIPGERWEIDILADTTVEIEIFKSNGVIFDENKLIELIK